MGLIKSNTSALSNVASGNYVIDETDAIKNGILAGVYKDGKLIEPNNSVNAKIAAQAAAEGLKSTVWQKALEVGGTAVKDVIKNITSSGQGAPVQNPSGAVPSGPVKYVPSDKKINWGLWIPVIAGVLVAAALFYKFVLRR